MARAADTYRGARRNVCIRELKGVWSEQWYYRTHFNRPRWWAGDNADRLLNRAAIYTPMLIRGLTYRKDKKGEKNALLHKTIKTLFSKKRHRRSTGIGGG